MGGRRLNSRLLGERDGERTFLLVFDTGEELPDQLLGFAREQGIGAATVSGIGAFSQAELGFFDPERKEYDRFPAEETEVLSLLGNLTLAEEGPRLHGHVVLGRRDGSAVGGHLFKGVVGPTLEVFLVDLGTEVRRAQDDQAGIPLIQL